SALYTAAVGQNLALTAPSLRSAVMWWLVGPPILVLAGWQMSRARRAAPGDARPRSEAAGGASREDVGAEMTDDELRARRAEWVFVIAMLLTLASVATQRLFLDTLDPVLLLLGLVAV